MENSEKLAIITILVPYRSTGNTILNKPTMFEVWKDAAQYRAVPQCGLEERRVASLPPQLLFRIESGKVISGQGPRDGNQHVLESIAKELQAQNLA